MMNISYAVGALSGASAILFCIAGILIGKDITWGKLMGLINEQPAKHYTRWGNQKQMKNILNLLPSLNISEKEMIIQRIFGRPISIIKGLDSDGSYWLDGVTYFQPNDDAKGFHFEEMINKRKEERSEIG